MSKLTNEEFDAFLDTFCASNSLGQAFKDYLIETDKLGEMFLLMERTPYYSPSLNFTSVYWVWKATL